MKPINQGFVKWGNGEIKQKITVEIIEFSSIRPGLSVFSFD